MGSEESIAQLPISSNKDPTKVADNKKEIVTFSRQVGDRFLDGQQWWQYRSDLYFVSCIFIGFQTNKLSKTLFSDEYIKLWINDESIQKSKS